MGFDYRQTYNEYWQKPDRWGSNSFGDPELLADRILRHCGGGRLLDLGCGMGELIRCLVMRGVDAHGLDVSDRVVENGNRFCPGRFHFGSAMQLPFEDQSFDTVVSTDCLEHLSENDVQDAISEIFRVCRHFVFIRVSTGVDRDGIWHLTVRNKSWWFHQFTKLGFHHNVNRFFQIPYDRMDEVEHEPEFVFCKNRAFVNSHRQYQSENWLYSEGRDSIAGLYRYAFFSRYFSLIRQKIHGKIRVCEIECGYGEGIDILRASQIRVRYLGVVGNPEKLEILNATYADQDTVFSAGSASDLDESSPFDFIIHNNREMHLDPKVEKRFLSRLRNSGRLFVVVPNHEHFVLTHYLERFEPLELEELYGQSIGDGRLFPMSKRELRKVEDVDRWKTVDAELWILVFSSVQLIENSEHSCSIETKSNFLDFNYLCDADNWLKLGCIGERINLQAKLCEIVEQVIDEKKSTGEFCVSLVVKGYQLLERPIPASEINAFTEELESVIENLGEVPWSIRWRYSMMYLVSLLYLKQGQLLEAEQRLRYITSCEDYERYGPTIGVCITRSAFMLGNMSAARGAQKEAISHWMHCIETCENLFRLSWVEILDEKDDPFYWGLDEMQKILLHTRDCAVALSQHAGNPYRKNDGFHIATSIPLKASPRAIHDVSFFEPRMVYFNDENAKRSAERLVRQYIRMGEDRPICLWGTGRLGLWTLDMLQRFGKQPQAVVDSNPMKIGAHWHGLDIQSPLSIPFDRYVTILSSSFSRDIIAENKILTRTTIIY